MAGFRLWPGQLGGRARTERVAFTLYGQAVAAARDPWFYARLGVPDTLDGRFDMVGLHAFLLIRRLNALPDAGAATGKTLAQGVFDAMFSDMDVTLRELGVGDMSIGKKVRAMWEAFHGRARAYEAALAQPAGEAGADPLAEALARNVWRDEAPAGAAQALAAVARAQWARLASADPAPLLAGKAGFAPAETLAGPAAATPPLVRPDHPVQAVRP